MMSVEAISFHLCVDIASPDNASKNEHGSVSIKLSFQTLKFECSILFTGAIYSSFHSFPPPRYSEYKTTVSLRTVRKQEVLGSSLFLDQGINIVGSDQGSSFWKTLT